MLVPVMTITLYYPQTLTKDSQELGTGEAASKAQGFESIYRSAQILGKETDHKPFFSSLISVTVLVATGLVIAAGASLYLKRKI